MYNILIYDVSAVVKIILTAALTFLILEWRISMTLSEASERFRISMDKLNYYAENELIRYEGHVNGAPDYTEEEIRKTCVISTLLKTGMDIKELKNYMGLFNGSLKGREEQIRILRKQRYKILEEIHCKQQLLDELDYMIDMMKKKCKGN